MLTYLPQVALDDCFTKQKTKKTPIFDAWFYVAIHFELVLGPRKMGYKLNKLIHELNK